MPAKGKGMNVVRSVLATPHPLTKWLEDSSAFFIDVSVGRDIRRTTSGEPVSRRRAATVRPESSSSSFNQTRIDDKRRLYEASRDRFDREMSEVCRLGGGRRSAGCGTSAVKGAIERRRLAVATTSSAFPSVSGPRSSVKPFMLSHRRVRRDCGETCPAFDGPRGSAASDRTVATEPGI